MLVTKDGHELLTRYPMDLDALMIRGWKLVTRVKGQIVRRVLGLAGKSPNARHTDAVLKGEHEHDI